MNRFASLQRNQRLLAAAATVATTVLVSHYVMHHFNNQSTTASAGKQLAHTHGHAVSYPGTSSHEHEPTCA